MVAESECGCPETAELRLILLISKLILGISATDSHFAVTLMWTYGCAFAIADRHVDVLRNLLAEYWFNEILIHRDVYCLAWFELNWLGKYVRQPAVKHSTAERSLKQSDGKLEKQSHWNWRKFPIIFLIIAPQHCVVWSSAYNWFSK